MHLKNVPPTSTSPWRGIDVSEAVDRRDILTFVVRLWRETTASGPDHWRGRVEHVASQEVGYVDNLGGVMDFIERWIRPDEEGMPMGE